MSLFLLIIIGVAMWSLLGVGTHRARYRSSRYRSHRMGLGRLPGDIDFRGRRTRVYAPIMSSLLISLSLSVVLTLLIHGAVR
ncbi:MAG: DUF2905 family protein [Actinomycetota bacterium]|nr:DUF2905 family protein [Actinomycetota bacterium]